MYSHQVLDSLKYELKASKLKNNSSFMQETSMLIDGIINSQNISWEGNMNEQELVQEIGNEICEGCGPDADCGEDPAECVRIATAIGLLRNYIGQTLATDGFNVGNIL